MKARVKLFVFLFLILIGWGIGFYSSAYCAKCLVINAPKNLFYGKLAIDLEKELKNKGYKFDCSELLPKTVIDFTYTNSQNYYHRKTKKRKIDTNIALVGDCFEAFDIDGLKQYDFLLVVAEIRFGYLAMFNFQAVHFPITEKRYVKHCDTTYDEKEINIIDVANQLDDFIQRTKK
ncbi:MAG: hypothetical protein IKW58_02255 [Alphaproteobacteria bacterium]|nr:hypothetical protein [Alphaproteobacteria bacterium]